MKPKHQVNSVKDAQSEVVTFDGQANQIVNMLKQHNTYDANYDLDYDETQVYVAVTAGFENLRTLEPVNIQVHFGNMDTKALMASSSFCTIIHKSPKIKVVTSNKKLLGKVLRRHFFQRI